MRSEKDRRRRRRKHVLEIAVILTAAGFLAFGLRKPGSVSRPPAPPHPAGPSETLPAPPPGSPDGPQAHVPDPPGPSPSEPAGPDEPDGPSADPGLWDTAGEDGFPYLTAVNIATQTVTVYEKDGAGNYTRPLRAMICSSGKNAPDSDTPTGFWHTTDRYEWRSLFGGVYGQYATRITGHILFHSVPYRTQNKGDLEAEEFNRLGTPASLGCIRLQTGDAKWIYDNCPSGSPVVIYEGDASTDPLGRPDFTPVPLTGPLAGWDPTDPDPANPCRAS